MSETSTPSKCFLVRGRLNSKINREKELNQDLGLDGFFKLDMSSGASIDLSPQADRSDESPGHRFEMQEGDVARLELSDGTELFLTPESLSEIYAGQSENRGGSDDEDLVTITSDLPSLEGERGLFSRLLKKLDIFNLKEKFEGEIVSRVGQEAIRALARKIEKGIIQDGGLFYASDIREQLIETKKTEQWKEAHFQPVPVSEIDISQPILVFIHGTFSSTAGGFSELLTDDTDGFWKELTSKFGSQIYAYDHRTLTESPIENARALCHSLPAGARLHLITHSRGGLVGEFLARGQSTRHEGKVFSPEELSLFSGQDVDGNIIERAFDWLTSRGAADNIYEQHLKELQSLDHELREKNLVIERFVRVACPARGTTLASGRLDVTLNIVLHAIGLIPGFFGSPIYSAVKTLLIAAVKDRTDPEAFPGLEAQMPRSPQIQLLNQRFLNGLDLSSSAHLAVIASDYEPTNKHRFYDWLVDLFYKGPNDLVVNFASMDGGVYRDELVPTMIPNRNVMHTNYFADQKVRDGIRALIVAGEDKPSGFQYLPRNTKALKRSRGIEIKPDSPCVIVVPGISGSNLRVDDDRVWVDKSDLMRGAFRKLDINSPHTISPDGPHKDSYQRLIEYLKESHKVVPFSYDWRKSILDAGDQLADEMKRQLQQTTGPVRIVAHSMGGLVCRAVMAEHHETWQEFSARKGARLIMLGTPNKGSHSILRLLVGQDSLINLLSLLDLSMSENDYLDILRKFPGVLELLPLSHDERAFEADLWNKFSSVMGRKWKAPTKTLLRKARKTWKTLESVSLDPEITLYVAGQARKTPCDYRVKGRLWKRLHFFASSRGDGRVLWSDGIPEGISHWYSPAKHGDLADHPRSFPAIVDLLEQGTTRLLPNRAWVSRGSEELTYLPPSHVPYLPPESEFGSIMMGGGSSIEDDPQSQLVTPTIRVSISHGNLIFCDQPVLVGHFINDPIEGSEGAIDQRLDGRLSERYRLGLYPERLNTSDLIRYSDQLGEFPGALVVGLGVMGELSPGKLTETLQTAFLRYSLETNEEAKGSLTAGLKLCALIPGAGVGGVSISDSIAAVLRAAIRANELLLSNPETDSLPLTEISFVEIYEDLAVEAQHFLLDLQDSPYFNEHITVEKRLVYGDGGLYRVSRGLDQSLWQRLRIAVDDGRMSFLPLSDRAGLPMITTSEERQAVDPFLRDVTRSTAADPDTGRVLHELLVPRALKSSSGDNRPLVLILDEQAAAYPWEILQYHEGESDRAMALRSPMVRQLSSPLVLRPKLCRNGKALIIADPTSDFPPLFGAQREGRAVRDLLEKKHLKATFEVSLHEKPDAQTVIRELMSREHHILHLAGHGVFEYVPKNLTAGEETPAPVSGMVIGDGLFLTPSLIERMPGTPEFVFINCCHLGNVDGDARPADFPAKPYQLAANLATQLINQGVRAVIAAGWAVDDQAALTFADCFYAEMMKGTNFGQSVFRARQRTHERHPSRNTWAAYQCYGDPSYVFTSHEVSSETEKIPDPVSLSEAIVCTANIGQKAKTLRGHCTTCVVENLIEFLEKLPADWRSNGKFAMTLGDTWIQLDELERAIEAYDLAQASGDSQITLRAIEKQAKNRARLTLKMVGQGDGGSTELKKSRAILKQCDQQIAKLEKQFGPTARRSACRGSIAKHAALLEATLGEAKSCEAPLRLMEEHYRKSFEQTRKDKGFIPYPLNNLLLAIFLRNPDNEEERSKDFRELLSFSKTLAGEDLIDMGELFWERAARPQQYALEALFNHSLKENIHNHAQSYLQVLKTAGSPRQINLVTHDLMIAETILRHKGQEDFAGWIEQLRAQI